MVFPLRRPRHLGATFVLGVTGLLWLGCSGWLGTKTDMIGVDRELAVEQGYVVPLQAQKVFVRDRKVERENVRTTWFRYRLPPQALSELQKELSGDEDIEYVENWRIPNNWPEFASIGFETPAWWSVSGAAYQQELTLDEAVAIPTGHLWALDDEEGEVYVWVWTYEGWRFASEQGLDPEPARPAPRGNEAVVEEAAAAGNR